MAATPTTKALGFLRRRGWTVEKVEQRLPIPDKFVTRDAFGFGDLLGMRPGDGIALIQVTSRPNVSSRLRKIREQPAARVWLESGGRILVLGFGKERGDVREEEVLAADLAAPLAAGRAEGAGA